MTIIRDVVKELCGMFLADARLTLATLLLVAIVGALQRWQAPPLLAGGVLLFGCLAILAGATVRQARAGARR
jgi:hypothetical protein